MEEQLNREPLDKSIEREVRSIGRVSLRERIDEIGQYALSVFRIPFLYLISALIFAHNEFVSSSARTQISRLKILIFNLPFLSFQVFRRPLFSVLYHSCKNLKIVLFSMEKPRKMGYHV